MLYNSSKRHQLTSEKTSKILKDHPTRYQKALKTSSKSSPKPSKPILVSPQIIAQNPPVRCPFKGLVPDPRGTGRHEPRGQLVGSTQQYLDEGNCEVGRFFCFFWGGVFLFIIIIVIFFVFLVSFFGLFCFFLGFFFVIVLVCLLGPQGLPTGLPTSTV